jgi:hypothetical protein
MTDPTQPVDPEAEPDKPDPKLPRRDGDDEPEGTPPQTPDEDSEDDGADEQAAE